ncbi:MAG: flagellar motor switch protein FliN [Candidatus Firestonebacteria bacterium]|nr:flagellar motor switch protein FliN [Candidatus Firestonebacteria bacterium]
MKGWIAMDNEKNNTNNTSATSQETSNADTKKQNAQASSVFPPLKEEAQNTQKDIANLELLMDISLPISVELGRTKMTIKDIVCLTPGAIIELNKFAGEPLDILVNSKPIAKGEVVVIDENFGIRIIETTDHQEKMKNNIEQKSQK